MKNFKFDEKSGMIHAGLVKSVLENSSEFQMFREQCDGRAPLHDFDKEKMVWPDEEFGVLTGKTVDDEDGRWLELEVVFSRDSTDTAWELMYKLTMWAEIYLSQLDIDALESEASMDYDRNSLLIRIMY